MSEQHAPPAKPAGHGHGDDGHEHAAKEHGAAAGKGGAASEHGHDAGKGHDAHDPHAAHGEGGEGHGEGGHGGGSKAIALTMALLGVMLAICAALVGSQRTELIAARVEQSTRLGLYMSETTKFRVMDSDLELLHAVTPSKGEVGKFESALKGVRAKSGKSDDEDTSELKDMLDTSTRSTADLLTPDPEDEARFQKIRGSYKHDMAEAKEDADAYDAVIDAHEKGAEGFETAQVMAEIGIVVASIALLSGSKIVWVLAMLVGVGGAGVLGKTYMQTTSAIQAGEEKIAAAKTATAKIEEADDGEADGKIVEKPGQPLKKE